MSLDNQIDSMSNLYGEAIADFQQGLVSEVMDLRTQGYSANEISNILQAIDMETYIITNYGSGKLGQFNSLYTNLLTNLEGFGPITPETLTALTNMSQATMFSNMVNTANQSREVLATGVLMNNTEEQLSAQLFYGQGGLTEDSAMTLANTLLNTYSRSVTRVMAEKMPDNTKYYYDGPVDERTRHVCVAMVGAGPLTMKQIDERYPGAFVDGGGWNCRHRWIMSTRANQGEHEKARKREKELIEKGNYNPKTLLEIAEEKT